MFTPGTRYRYSNTDNFIVALMAEAASHRSYNALLASTVWGALSPRELVAWVLEDGLPVRVQVQLHKVIWGAEAQGV